MGDSDLHSDFGPVIGSYQQILVDAFFAYMVSVYSTKVLILCSSHLVCVEKPRLMYMYIKLRISTCLVEFWKRTHKVGTQFIILVTAPSNMEFYP